MEPRAAEQLAGFALGLEFEHIPSDVVAKVRWHLLDTIGVALAGAEQPSATAVREMLVRRGGKPQAQVWGWGFRLPASSAAMANGVAAHSLDFDDTHLPSITHLSGCILPAVLSVAEAMNADGRAALTALVAGYEVGARVGLAAAGGFHARGFHATPLCGAFGATAAAARLLNLDAATMTHAIGIVGSQASGIQAFLNDGSWTKHLHAGWAAHAGVTAAELAGEGFKGPAAVLEGRFGFLSTHLGSEGFDPDRLVSGLGETWETRALCIKPYPCCHFNHAAVHAALRLRAAHTLAPDEIVSVEAIVPTAVVPIVCEPRAVKLAPPTPHSALFSLPFCVAFALIHGHLGLGDFTEQSIVDKRVLALAGAVDCRGSDGTAFPQVYPGAVRVHLRDGRCVEWHEGVNPGHADAPLPVEQVHQKFRSLATRVLSAEAVEAVISTVSCLELNPIDVISACLATPGRAPAAVGA